MGPAGIFVPCGGQAVLPPGTYRLLPQGEAGYRGGEERSVELPPSREEVVEVAFGPLPVKPLEEAWALEVSLPQDPVAPGEEEELVVRPRARLLLKEGERVLWEGEGEGSLRFQVPWEVDRARGPLVLEVQGEGGSRTYPLALDPGRELLLVELSPVRAALGEEVEVRARVRFPAESVEVLLPGGQAMPLGLAGERVFAGRFRVGEDLLGEASPVGRYLGVPLRVEAWQGEKRVGKGVRLLVQR